MLLLLNFDLLLFSVSGLDPRVVRQVLFVAVEFVRLDQLLHATCQLLLQLTALLKHLSARKKVTQLKRIAFTDKSKCTLSMLVRATSDQTCTVGLIMHHYCSNM